MQGLSVLYKHLGKHNEWKRLVVSLTPLFVGEEAEPQCREAGESLFLQYNSNIAREEGRWKDAEALIGERLRLSTPQLNNSLLDAIDDHLTDNEKRDVHNFANSLHDLAEIRRLLGKVECFADYREALKLFERIGSRSLAAGVASNLGHAYLNLRTDF